MLSSLLKVACLTVISGVSPLKDISSNCDPKSFEVENYKTNKNSLILSSEDYIGYLGDFTKYDTSFSDLDIYEYVNIYGDFKLQKSNFAYVSNYEEEFIYCDFMQINQGENGLNIWFNDNQRLGGLKIYINGSPSSSTYLVSQTFFLRGNVDIDLSHSSLQLNQFLSMFDSCFSSSYEVFNFSDVINYNAMYGLDIFAWKFADSTQLAWNLDNKVIFEVDGVFYDSITSSSFNCYDYMMQEYNPNTGVWGGYILIENTDYKFVNSLNFEKHYKTDDTHWSSLGHTIGNYFNKRLHKYYTYSGVDRDLVDHESYFISPNYKSIKVYKIDEASKNNLYKFNIKTTFNVNQTEYFNGLNASFLLISSTISGLARFLNMNILPGISIGAIIFVPFAITLMLFIIKLFKR